jgi:hypothetical protein
MSSEIVERLRLPLAIGLGVLLLLAVYLFARGAEPTANAEPTASIVVGEPGGGVIAPSDSPTPSPTSAPTATPAAATPSATAAPTPTPVPVAQFSADVMACRSLDGPQCVGELRDVEQEDGQFMALVLFENAVAGDVMNAVLTGPSGTIEGGGYALPNGGRGWYYSTIPVSGLEEGEYTLTAFRNGEAVDAVELRLED